MSFHHINFIINSYNKMANKENTIKTIEECVEDFSMNHVSKRKDFGYKGLIWLALGIAAIIAQMIFDKENGSLTMALLILGISLIIFGLIVFLVKKERYFYDGKPMTMREFMFNSDRFDEIQHLYNEGKFSEMADVSRSSASKMKLKILYANDYSVAFSQIFKFVGYDFEPADEVRVHDKTQCNSLNTLVISY